MISSKTQKYLKRNWPEIGNKEVLHNKIEDRLKEMTTNAWKDSKDTNKNFLREVQSKSRSSKFAGIGLIILSFLMFVQAGGSFTFGALVDLVIFLPMGIIVYRGGVKSSYAVKSYLDLKSHLAVLK